MSDQVMACLSASTDHRKALNQNEEAYFFLANFSTASICVATSTVNASKIFIISVWLGTIEFDHIYQPDRAGMITRRRRTISRKKNDHYVWKRRSNHSISPLFT
jgi:hypothetical protein